MIRVVLNALDGDTLKSQVFGRYVPENWRGIVRLEGGESHVPKWYCFRNNVLYHPVQASVPLRVEIVYVRRNAVGCQY